ncbi:MAG: TenA family protein [Actinomycetota bacterium]|nr:TenA family protein [Actinomycetota bacterium]
MSLAAQLWAANADLADAALAHPFVAGLGDGSLPEAAFAGYVAQDAFFLESFARAYALALAHAPDREGLDAFAGLIAGVLEELRLHAGYAARLGIPMVEVLPHEATLAYTEFLLATAAVGDVGRICAAMTPCMRLYAHLGSALAARGAHGTYQEWVQTYAGAGFAALAARLEALLDRYATPTEPVRSAYRRAMRLEVAFFEAAYVAS